MCIAIYSPAGKYIKEDTLRICFTNHPDGIGYAFIDQGKIQVRKFMKFTKFYKLYKKDFHSHKDSPFIIHFRKTSAGATIVDNCHPFVVNKHQVFVHNGTIKAITLDLKSKDSDTIVFNKKILQKLPMNWYKNKAIVELLSGYVGIAPTGRKNKLIFLNSDKTYLIINEDAGIWDDGIWWSNDDYKAIKKKKYQYYQDNEYYRNQNFITIKVENEIISCRTQHRMTLNIMYLQKSFTKDDRVILQDVSHEENKLCSYSNNQNTSNESNKQDDGYTFFMCDFCGNSFPNQEKHKINFDLPYFVCGECKQRLITMGWYQ